MLGTEDGGKRVAMVSAGFYDFSGEPLGNFDSFRDAAALGDQAWNIRARPQIAAISDLAHANSDRYFLHPCDMLLLSHCRITWNAFYQTHNRMCWRPKDAEPQLQ